MRDPSLSKAREVSRAGAVPGRPKPGRRLSRPFVPASVSPPVAPPGTAYASPARYLWHIHPQAAPIQWWASAFPPKGVGLYLRGSLQGVRGRHARHSRTAHPAVDDPNHHRRRPGAGPERRSRLRHRRPVVRSPSDRRQQSGAVVLDLSAVTFMDSSTISVLAARHGNALSAGGWIRLAAMSHPVQRVVELIGLDMFPARYPTLGQALAP
ncbi:STAS domain-containing protein [Streptomyces sp. NPDC002769]|uniref:STAS domain-containing protein n=1 Tax=Streptomyces sp. NPDC002769 TaxID=3154542 RepID=UPI00331B0836